MTCSADGCLQRARFLVVFLRLAGSPLLREASKEHLCRGHLDEVLDSLLGPVMVAEVERA